MRAWHGQQLSERGPAVHDGRYLHTVSLVNNDISSIPEFAFNGFAAVRYLDLSNNPIGTLPGNAMWGMRSLQQLLMSNCRLTSIGKGLFRDTGQITHLYMSKNFGLSTVPSDLFTSMGRFTEWHVENAPLTGIAKELFSRNKNLGRVTMHGARVSILPKDLFKNSPYFKYLGGMDGYSGGAAAGCARPPFLLRPCITTSPRTFHTRAHARARQCRRRRVHSHCLASCDCANMHACHATSANCVRTGGNHFAAPSMSKPALRRASHGAGTRSGTTRPM